MGEDLLTTLKVLFGLAGSGVGGYVIKAGLDRWKDSKKLEEETAAKVKLAKETSELAEKKAADDAILKRALDAERVLAQQRDDDVRDIKRMVASVQSLVAESASRKDVEELKADLRGLIGLPQALEHAKERFEGAQADNRKRFEKLEEGVTDLRAEFRVTKELAISTAQAPTRFRRKAG